MHKTGNGIKCKQAARLKGGVFDTIGRVCTAVQCSPDRRKGVVELLVDQELLVER